MSDRRITLVTRDPKIQQRDWDLSNPAGSHLIFVDSVNFLPHAIARGLTEDGYDIERVVIDRTGTALQFVEFLATLPVEFAGDVVYISRDGKAFLSSSSRGDGRVLYMLGAADVEFYLQTNSLTWRSLAGEVPVKQIASA
jgi:hypothetical protein